jgi:hypothetical protein
MSNDEGFAEGWWLMSVPQLEGYLAAWRAGDPAQIPAGVRRLAQEEALIYRDRGNLPDHLDRSLRLLLRIESESDLRSLDTKRLQYEPDAHAAPHWRVEGSRPVNVVPLRRPGITPTGIATWEDDPAMAAMEQDWQDSGKVRGLAVPGEFRGFVFKTVTALEAAGSPVTVASITDSVARWLAPDQVKRLRAALDEANATG